MFGFVDEIALAFRRRVLYWSRVAFRVRVVSIDGVHVNVDRRALSPTAVGALLRGDYERPEREALERTLLPDDVVLELGSGIGYLAVVACKLLGPGAEFYGFEPSP